MIKGPKFKAATLWLLVLFLFSQCTKIDTTSVGSGLIPPIDNVHTFDTTLNVIATNFDEADKIDSVSRRDLQALGIIQNDPLFGSSKAEMYFELKPAAYPFTLPAHDTLSMVVDSVVMVLKYDHSFGDSTVQQKVKLYELSNALRVDSAYRTTNQMSHESDLLGEKTFTPSSLRDSIRGFGENAASQLRIRMPDSWGTDFITNVSNFTKDSAYKVFFKGFALVPDDATGGQALNYFNLSSVETRVAMYVRYTKDAVKDTAMVNLNFSDNAAQGNYIHRERNGSQITNYLSNPSTGDSILFIQTSPGSYAKLKIPALNGMSNRVIHRAELIVDQIYEPSVFSPPAMLFLDMLTDTVNKTYIPIPCDFGVDQLRTGFSYFGGKPKNILDEQGNPVVRYSFNISRYVQGVITRGLNSSELRLRAPFYIDNYLQYTDRCDQIIQPFAFRMNNIADGRVKLNGTNQTSSHIRLRMVYSVF